ncbi:hypothetical protein BpHYR1_013197 [Brachionus plicatilis]|uniref:Uncharacterized protein n=1 Tax=Brachionus plicatilis TaxID=10195 RepID=A0A3M7RT46_BRAPC|nr:hypothetical protein BpHYR1_013197 [Brachionus plicatilis]
MTCSKTLGNTIDEYKSTVIDSSWERRTKLVPTKNKIYRILNISIILLFFTDWNVRQKIFSALKKIIA